MSTLTATRPPSSFQHQQPYHISGFVQSAGRGSGGKPPSDRNNIPDEDAGEPEKKRNGTTG